MGDPVSGSLLYATVAAPRTDVTSDTEDELLRIMFPLFQSFTPEAEINLHEMHLQVHEL